MLLPTAERVMCSFSAACAKLLASTAATNTSMPFRLFRIRLGTNTLHNASILSLLAIKSE